MKTLSLNMLLTITCVCTNLAASDHEIPISLEQAKELGRTKSGFLKDADAATIATSAIPDANLAHFQEAVGPILNKSCLACHGPEKSEGRLRIDELNPDLLTGPDVERWREVYNVVSNSEMPPKDEPEYALADARARRWRSRRRASLSWLHTAGAKLNRAVMARQACATSCCLESRMTRLIVRRTSSTG